MSHKRKIIVDESISENQSPNIEIFLTRKRINFSNLYLIAKENEGIPDYQIIHFLLDKSTILFTSDRPFHNTVLSKGYTSYYFNGDNFSPKKLNGIKTIKLPLQIKKDLHLKDSYHEPKTEIRSLVLPKSAKVLKKLRTKRRRIKSHFGGTENMEQVAITVSFKPSESSMIIGIKVRIASNSGIKAIDASENYITEKIEHENRQIVALNYSMILAIQLMLNNVKTTIFFDTQNIDDPQRYLTGEASNQYQFMFKKLIKGFKQIIFTPSSKGPFIEKLRRKLVDLSKSNSNEIVRGRIIEIEKDIRQFYSENNLHISV
jgi:hypothetical protein